ncbi:molybdate transport system substrate-binding protein [Arthrobacter sp. PvP102]|uniref:molybdate ABC transporter substrate-binding protein n=1 Tax=unclassified Arthrobacter TaxID=235627 RepID=UPI001AE7C015|nr:MULTISPECIES: molybdate ABC transporter substrate-binding protein [unclassified Arthrobacter]MBP1233135.1 molybdate transport system substrate-binding protein [Arthrobacter sp. PvP103]MBP1238270.1 molybdate transport system substrate-binding protein [Arthrobacter sp. PvP102]
MNTRKPRVAALLTAAALTAGLAACAPSASTSAGPAAGASSDTAGQLSGTITVFAAASLKATFTTLADEFEKKNPGTKVTLSFAGSSDLATQISQGAPADVFASADTTNMAKLADAGLLDGAATNFATNVLQIAVPPSNPASIGSFADLARPGVKVVVCAGQVPCGAAADAVEKAAGVTIAPVSEESSVTDVLGKVTSGEADAGLVYVTDVKAAGTKAKGIPFAEAGKAVNTYPIATVGASRNKQLAAAFVAMVASADGRKTLADAGFGAP